jgi:hypothetical protein
MRAHVGTTAILAWLFADSRRESARTAIDAGSAPVAADLGRANAAPLGARAVP